MFERTRRQTPAGRRAARGNVGVATYSRGSALSAAAEIPPPPSTIPPSSNAATAHSGALEDPSSSVVDAGTLPARRLLWKQVPEPTANTAVRNPAGGYKAALMGKFVVTDESDITAAAEAARVAVVRPASSRRAATPTPSAAAPPLHTAGAGGVESGGMAGGKGGGAQSSALVTGGDTTSGTGAAAAAATSSTFRDAFLPDGSVNPNADEERTRCFRKLVLTGASGFVFGDTYSASEFRWGGWVGGWVGWGGVGWGGWGGGGNWQ